MTCRSTLQFTVDEDVNVPDAKPDMVEILMSNARLCIQEQHVKSGKCFVRGVLKCTVLYRGEDDRQAVWVLENEIPFDEVIHMDCEGEGDSVRVSGIIEEQSAVMIHSRKCGIRALLRFNLTARRLTDVETVVGIAAGGDDVEQNSETKKLWSIVADKSENYRFRDNLLIPGGKPEIGTLLYRELDFRNMEFRAQSEQLLIKGEVVLFALYLSPQGETVWLCEELPMTATIPMSGIREETVPHIVWEVGECSVLPQEDSDGEMRILEAEAVLMLQVLAYEEEECRVLTDLYSVEKKLNPIYRESPCERLVTKNMFRFRVDHREMEEAMSGSIRCICYADAEVKVDSVTRVDGGLSAEGVVEAKVFYETENGASPIGCHRAQIPFSQVIEIRDVQESSGIYVQEVIPGIDRISVSAPGGNELEIKAAVRLDTLMLEERAEHFLVDVTEEAYDEKMLAGLPSLVCYFVREGDSLWNIAKEHHTTIGRIAQYNPGLKGDVPPVGSRLLLVRPQLH